MRLLSASILRKIKQECLPALCCGNWFCFDIFRTVQWMEYIYAKFRNVGNNFDEPLFQLHHAFVSIECGECVGCNELKTKVVQNHLKHVSAQQSLRPDGFFLNIGSYCGKIFFELECGFLIKTCWD